jgi:3-deoxy-manno-octulosonate cytidylyltransferase (CMP-KDO synthetase)
MDSHIIIPARLDSIRLPKKLLLSDTGMPLIWHTIQRAKSSKLSNSVIVATDSHKIFNEIKEYVAVVMTGQHSSGTERIADCCKLLVEKFGPDDIVVNLQGDEPELECDHIDSLIGGLKENEDCDIATLASPASQDEYASPDVVKVVINNNGHAMYFSRCSIPYKASNSLKHVGVYAYRIGFLNQWRRGLCRFNNMKLPRECHKNEKLEQLQWLENGFNIKVLVRDIKTAGIDTREEYDAFVKRLKN